MNGWALAARYARRELRAGLPGFRVFLACLALGVAAIAGVGTLSESIQEGLRQDARSLNGGDLSVRLVQRTASEAEHARLDAGGRLSETLEMRAMARVGADGARRALVELKAVDDAYPLVGTVALEDGGDLHDALGTRDGLPGAAVDRSLLVKLELAPGGTVAIGEARFRIAGVIRSEPDRIASVLSYGPRVMIAAAALPATGLVQPGSQIRYHYRVLTPSRAAAGALAQALETEFPKAGWRIATTDDAAPGIRRFVERMELFLTFVGLTTLLVGGVGVTNAVSSYLDGRMSTIAMFKCLGGSAAFIFRLYLLQVMALALVGTAIGLALGVALPLVAVQALKGLLPVDPVLAVYWLPLAAAAAYGLLIAFTFALWPLVRARSVSPASLFRAKVAAIQGMPKLRDLAALALCGAALSAFTVFSASQRWFAIWFVLGALASFALLALCASGLKRIARSVQRFGNVRLRLALANLHRPGAPTGGIVLSLGLGLSVLVAIVLIESNLNRQLEGRLSESAPAFFFLDIQPDQVTQFDRTVAGAAGASDYRRVASLRGRIVAIKGVPVEQADIASDAEWAVRGDRALTYAANPPDNAEIVAGTWWPADYKGAPLVSMDSDIARGFGVGIGDALTLNVLGRDIEVRVASLRAIDWRSLRFDFALIVSPGVLEAAPHTHIAAVRVPESDEDAIERAVARDFVNVSVIRVREALDAARAILVDINLAVSAVAAVTIVAGALVLAGAVAAGRRRRVFDAVVFKVLGATRRDVLRTFLLEFGLLGLSTGAVAALVGSLVAWAVTVWLMELAWGFDPLAVAITVAATVAMALVAGFAGTWRALGQKAAPLLRNE